MRTEGWRTEVILHGMRWANNILTEVVGSHGVALNDRARELMLELLSKLNEAQDEVRRAGRKAAPVPEGGGGER